MQSLNIPPSTLPPPDHAHTVQQNFVKTIRAVELLLGVPVPGLQPINFQSFASNITGSNLNMSSAIPLAAQDDKAGIFTPEIVSVLHAAVPMLIDLKNELGMDKDALVLGNGKQFGGNWDALFTKYVHSCIGGVQL